MPRPTLLEPGSLEGGPPGAAPIELIEDWLKSRMAEFGAAPPAALADRVLLVRSETGSGKSTVLPAHVLRLVRGRGRRARAAPGPGVVCTQPRVLTAQTLARDQGGDRENYPDLVLGETVGYKTGAQNLLPREGRALTYATLGAFQLELRERPFDEVAGRYRFIIVDEAHERSVETDLFLMALKKFLRLHLGDARLPFVILASATLPLRELAAFFEVGPGANAFEIRGRAFPIRRVFPSVGTNDYPAAAAEQALRLHRENPRDPPAEADILIFMPGGAEIQKVCGLLLKANLGFIEPGSAVPPFVVLRITREDVQTNSADYQKLKVPAGDPRLCLVGADGALLAPARRIIVATVVAETGLTLDNLKYVIDGGWSREREVYYPGGLEGLVDRPAPRSRVLQRMGRAGRRFPGEFHPLYTRNVFRALEEKQLPAIVLQGVARHFLEIAEAAADPAGVFRVAAIDMVDPPPTDALAAALEEAVAFGYLRATPAALAAGGHALTRLGRAAARAARWGKGVGMPQTQTLFAGFLWGASLQDLATVAALYDFNDPLFLYAGKDPAQRAKARRRAVYAALPPYFKAAAAARAPGDAYLLARLYIADDFVEALFVFSAFARVVAENRVPPLRWCEAHGADYESAVALARRREEMIEAAAAAGVDPFHGEAARLAAAPAADFRRRLVALKRCVHAGLRFSVLARGAAGHYRTRAGDRVRPPPLFSRDDLDRLESLRAGAPPRPLQVATNRVVIRRETKGKPPPLLYNLHAAFVSVLDGFVAPDAAAGEPRRLSLAHNSPESKRRCAAPSAMTGSTGKKAPAQGGPGAPDRPWPASPPPPGQRPSESASARSSPTRSSYSSSSSSSWPSASSRPSSSSATRPPPAAGAAGVSGPLSGGTEGEGRPAPSDAPPSSGGERASEQAAARAAAYQLIADATDGREAAGGLLARAPPGTLRSLYGDELAGQIGPSPVCGNSDGGGRR